jgi:DNA-binding response OmpR family regulator
MDYDVASDTEAIPRILVVDDEPFIRTTVREALGDEGYEVSEARSSEACLKLLAARPFAAVLLDIKMPGMDGMEAFRRICKDGYHVEVIMMSGHGTIETAVEAVKGGAYDFLEKPFSLIKLKRVVKSALAHRHDKHRLEVVNEKDKMIGKFRIIGKISSGGTATVYRAVQADLGRTVALKILHSHLTETQEFHERFFREAKITASLSHPNIIQIFDYGREQSHHYLAMELVEGWSLDRYLSGKAWLPLPTGLFIMLDICRALEHAHQRSVIHRDLKPQNILIARDGSVKLADFGMARLLDGSMQHITAPNHVAGTPQFMSPEQVRGGEVGAASDIFSLGTLLYLMATTRLPFSGAHIAEVIHRVSLCTYDEPIRVNPKIGERLNGVIVTCLQADTAKRYSSIAKVRKNIAACIDEKDRMNREHLTVEYFAAQK